MKIALLVIGWFGGWIACAFFASAGAENDLFSRVYPIMPHMPLVYGILALALFSCALFCRLKLARLP